LSEAGVDEKARINLLALPQSSLDDLRAAYEGDEKVEAAASALARVLGHLTASGFGRYVRFDASLVRGLAYYTGTVFEIWERSGQLRAVCGGGRYDDLLASLGGADLPALGFGMGDVVLGELLKDLGLAPETGLEIDDFVVCVSEDQREVALGVGAALRRRGRRVLYDLQTRGVSRQFKAANRVGAARAIVVGPDEVARGVVTERDMASGVESDLLLNDLLERPEDES